MIFSLERRFVLLLLIPVALILTIGGVAGFIYVRGFVFGLWVETTDSKLEKAVLEIRNRLNDKVELINLIAKAETMPGRDISQAFLIQQLAARPGVKFVDLDDAQKAPSGQGDSGNVDGDDDMSPANGLYTVELCDEDIGFCAPTTDPGAADRSLRIGKKLPAVENRPPRRLLVRVSFDSLLEPIREMELWPGSRALLVTGTGQVLASTDKSHYRKRRLGDAGDAIEKNILADMLTKSFGTVFGRGHPPDVVACFYKVPVVNWFLILLSEGNVVLEPMVRFRFYVAVAGIVGLLIILSLIRLATRPVAHSISAIAAAAAQVKEGDYAVTLPETRTDEIGQLARSFGEMIEGLKQRDFVQYAFGRYVDRKVAEELMSGPEALRMGGEKRVVTIMMADLRNFTSISEKLEPEEVIKILNRYFSRMIRVIDHYKGIIVDFYGDSILVFFDGSPEEISGRAADALNCAIEMQREQIGFVEKLRSEGVPTLMMGVGIHTGEVIVGNIGAESRAKYGIVGSNVNLTARIQSTAGPGRVVISEETRQVLGDRIAVAESFGVCLKGVEKDRELYEVECLDGVCILPQG
jgi:class 3 adenylate cyclase